MSRTRLALSSLPVIATVGTILLFIGTPASSENQDQKNPQSQSRSQPNAGTSNNDYLKIINNPGGGQIVYGPHKNWSRKRQRFSC